MKKICLFLFIILAAGCATQTRVDIKPLPIPPLKEERKFVAVLPLNTSFVKDWQKWNQINIAFYEAFKRNLLASCFFTVPYEEVINILEQEGKIERPSPQKIKISPSLLEVYQEDWSPLMKEEIGAIIKTEIRRQISPTPSPKLALTRKDIIQIGKKAGARYVLWARLNEFALRQEDTLNPFKIGILTAQNRFLARLFYGAPESGAYGTAQEVSIGGLIGGIIGSNAKDPFEPPHKKTVRVGHPLFGQEFTKYSGGTEDYDLANALFWGSAGMLVSYLAAHGGNAPEAVLGLSVYLYDVEKEQIVWENRIRLRTSPQSVWAARHPEDLILQAIEEAARYLSIQMSADLGFSRIVYLVENKQKESEN